jgi:hydroxymethylpyrimidine pyrophosphatase-like HAD family hydrolase
MNRAVVFDVDNTLTKAREALDQAMARRLSALGRPFALAAGSDRDLLMSQFFQPLHAHGFRGQFDAFLCNGALRYHCRCEEELEVSLVGEFSLRNHLGEWPFGVLLQVLAELLEEPRFALPKDVSVVGERIIDRRGMINLAPSGREPGALSTAGRHSRDQFVNFDAQTGYRARLMPVLRSTLDEVLPGNDLRLSLGGQTSFDIVVQGRDKSFAVRSLLEEGMQHVTYVGDALFPGGNDAAVVDFILAWQGSPCPVDVIQVRDVAHTAELLDGWAADTGR